MTEADRDAVQDRMSRAWLLGWDFKDSQLTPGIPRLAVHRPDGTFVGILSTMPDQADLQLTEMGVPLREQMGPVE